MNDQRIASALSYIPADDRATWVRMAMAIRSECGETGFDIWDQWSQTAGNYHAVSARSVWRSCRGSGITLGSLFALAKDHGWRDNEQYERPTSAQMAAQRQERLERATREGQQREREAQAAARKAQWTMGQTQPEEHAYLQSKGWPELKGAVWRPDAEQNLLCIPMRIAGSVVGVQMIDRQGGKKYLTGQRTSGATYQLTRDGRGAKDWLVEGYATGLSLRDCLHALRLPYRIHVTFSAGNLVQVARRIGSGIVVADHDASHTGQNAAQQAGLPYFLPPEGDFNDLHRAIGTFAASQQLCKWLQQPVNA